MKKLLFVAGSLRIGGIERSLVNLLNQIDYKQYEVDLFLYSNVGEYLDDLPSEVRLINQSQVLNIIGLTMSEVRNTKNIFWVLLRAVVALICKVIGSKAFWNIAFKLTPKLSGYDAAIAYSNNVHNKSLYSGYYHFILQRVEANSKIGWVHTDYRSLVNIQDDDKYYFDRLDKIVHVSKACKNEFDEIFPDYTNKTFVVYNMIPIDFIRRQSLLKVDLEDTEFPNGKDTIGVTVARLDQNKSVDRIIKVLGKLKNEGITVKWMIVGDGPERKSLEIMAEQYGVKEHVLFLGMQKNPYSFIRIANIFILCSKYEGYPMVIGEAQAIATPVLVTRYRAAEEQIENGFNGAIVDNSVEAIYKELKILINSNSILERMKYNLLNKGISNHTAIKQLSLILP